MPFNREAEENELERHIELIFKSGRPRDPNDLSLGPSAYIAMGSCGYDLRNRPMLTGEEKTFGALKGKVDFIKMSLDARLAEAKAQFSAAGIDV